MQHKFVALQRHNRLLVVSLGALQTKCKIQAVLLSRKTIALAFSLAQKNSEKYSISYLCKVNGWPFTYMAIFIYTMTYA
jgi:hypothetical protein